MGHVHRRRVSPGPTSLITAEKKHRFAHHGEKKTPVRGPDRAARALSHMHCYMVDNHEAVARVISVAAEYRQVPPRTLSLITVDNRHRFTHHGREKYRFTHHGGEDTT